MTDTTAVPTTFVPPVGTPGLNVMGGRVYEELDARLRGDRAIKTYREMADDPTIHAVLFAFEAMVRAAGFRVDSADPKNPAADDEATRTKDDLDQMEGAWSDTLSEILSCLAYGYSLFEQEYRRADDGRIVWTRWAPRSQDSIIEWVFDQTTWEATHAIQQAPPTFARNRIPLEPGPDGPGCLHFRIRPRKQNPQGTSLLRACYEPWYFTRHIQRIEAIGIERDLTGIPVLGVPIDISDEERATWAEIGQKINLNETAYLLQPTDVHDGTSVPKYSFTLVNSGGERTIDTDKVLARYERKIFRAFLASFLTLGDTSVGSYALGSTQADFFITAAKAVLEGIQDTINVDAIRRKARMNGTPEHLIPTFRFNEVGQRDVKAFAETVGYLVTAGLADPADGDLRRHVAEVMGLPVADVTDEQPTNQPKPLPAGGQQPPVTATDATRSRTLTFAEITIDEDAIKRAQKAWDESCPVKYHGMLDAEVENDEEEAA